ncbi:MAG: c-type cytochrome [Sinobacteraceae bacterium]|nr:c-type cytochrome [Nevskiaceae bacterium]
MTGLLKYGSGQRVGRRVQGFLWATSLVALSLPVLMAQPAGVTPNTAGTSTAAVTDSPAYKRGRLLFIQCRACHDLKPSPVEKVGPNLAGLFGRAAAAAPDFGYSPALRSAKITWDRQTLDTWLEKPGSMVPGNIMAFAGIANPADRAALISYIEVESASR